MYKNFIFKQLLIALWLLFSVQIISAQVSKTEVNKVISYNIRLSAGADGKNSWTHRKAATLRMIEQEKPLVMGLQEAMYDQVQYLDKHLTGYKRVGVGRDDGKLEGEFMAVYFDTKRCKLLNSGTFWLSQTPTKVSRGWDAACHRTLTWLRLKHKASGKVFYVFNTHLDHSGELARKESIVLVDSLITNIVPTNSVVVLMGDFNMEPQDLRLLPITKKFDNSRNCSPITDKAGTYNGFANNANQPIIDYIFSKNLNCKVYSTLITDYGVPFISDHYPISFIFEFLK